MAPSKAREKQKTEKQTYPLNPVRLPDRRTHRDAAIMISERTAVTAKGVAAMSYVGQKSALFDLFSFHPTETYTELMEPMEVLFDEARGRRSIRALIPAFSTGSAYAKTTVSIPNTKCAKTIKPCERPVRKPQIHL